MEVSNLSTDNGGHGGFDVNGDTLMENRHYRLNVEKAMEKKLQFTNRDEIRIEESGGGLKIILNTGMYELVKSRIDSYFSTESLQYRYTYTPVADNCGNIVETKYKISKGKSNLYTLNMYHTKCSYLVNGRNPMHFVTTDLKNILEIIISELNKCGSSVTETNNGIRNILLQLKQNDTYTKNVNHSATAKSNSLLDCETEKVPTHVSVNSEQTKQANDDIHDIQILCGMNYETQVPFGLTYDQDSNCESQNQSVEKEENVTCILQNGESHNQHFMNEPSLSPVMLDGDIQNQSTESGHLLDTNQASNTDEDAVRHYYYRDNLHINAKGTSRFLRQINTTISIMKSSSGRKTQPSPAQLANHSSSRLQRAPQSMAASAVYHGPTFSGDRSQRDYRRYGKKQRSWYTYQGQCNTDDQDSADARGATYLQGSIEERRIPAMERQTATIPAYVLAAEHR